MLINYAATICVYGGTRRRLLDVPPTAAGNGRRLLSPNFFLFECPRVAGSGGLSLYSFDKQSAQYVEAYVLPVTLNLTGERGRCGRVEGVSI